MRKYYVSFACELNNALVIDSLYFPYRDNIVLTSEIKRFIDAIKMHFNNKSMYPDNIVILGWHEIYDDEIQQHEKVL